MSKPLRILVVVVTGLLGALGTFGQIKMPPETRNAALRYWMAFSELQETDAEEQAYALLEKMISGELPWDDTKFGHVLNENEEAIQTMQRASRLPECDWGIEYSLGPRTPNPFVPNSARALARLNTLYGMRLAAKGDSAAAVDTWLAGIRF